MPKRLMKFVVLSILALLVAIHLAAAGPASAQSAAQHAGTAVRAPQSPAKAPSSATGDPEPPRSAAAVARSFAELADRIETGDTVFVTRRAGERTRAEVQGFDADLETLFLSASGTSFGLTEEELNQLELRYSDSLANGAVIGAVAGSSLFVIAGIACALVDGCNAASETFAAAAVMGGIGAGIGVAVDGARKTERLVYVSPKVAAGAIGVRPVISRTRQGAVLVLRF